MRKRPIADQHLAADDDHVTRRAIRIPEWLVGWLWLLAGVTVVPVVVVVLFGGFIVAYSNSHRLPDQIGVSGTADGTSLRLYFRPCADDSRILSVSLYDSDWEGASDQSLVWQVTSQSGSDLKEFTIGETPDGFVESFDRLSEPLNAEHLHAIIDVSTSWEFWSGEERVTFPRDSIRPDLIRSDGKWWSVEEFNRRGTCSGGTGAD